MNGSGRVRSAGPRHQRPEELAPGPRRRVEATTRQPEPGRETCEARQPQRPKKGHIKIGRLGVQRPKPPGAPQSAKREGARKGETPRERMSTQADSRKHSLGVTRPEGLSQTGGGLQAETWKIPPHPECSYNPTSQRLGGNGHPRGLARRHMANQCCEGNCELKATPRQTSFLQAEGREVVAMPSGTRHG